MPYLWPEHLVSRIIANDWILFVGSGVSATAVNAAGEAPPTWRQLLERLATIVPDDALRRTAEDLISREQYLAAADHIRYACDRDARIQSYLACIKSAVEGPLVDRFQPSEWHNLLLALDPRIIFTTNFDKLLETAALNGFAVHSYESQGLSHDLRRGDPVLVKLHGSIDAVSNIVLTRPAFVRVAREGRAVFEALRGLSLTSTVLFVGYSLTDPDVQLVLSEVGRSSLDPEAHFMLASEPESAADVPVFRESFGVSVLPYPAGDHGAGLQALRDLVAAVAVGRS